MTDYSKKLKLHKFKNLIAHTVTASIVFSPLLLMSGAYLGGRLALSILGGPPSDFLLNTLTVTSIGASLAQLIFGAAKFIEPDSIFNSSYWKKFFNSAFAKEIGLENGKIIHSLREFKFGSEPPVSAYPYLAQLVINDNIQKLDAARLIYNMTNKPLFSSDYDDGKQKDFQEKLSGLINTDSLSSILSKVVGEQLNNPAFIQVLNEQMKQRFEKDTLILGIDTLLSKTHDNAGELDFSAVFMKRASFILSQKDYPGLCSVDYQDFQKLVEDKDSHSYRLGNLLNLFYSHPEKVNWIEIKNIFIKNYNQENNFFTEHMGKILEITKQQEKILEQNQIKKEVIALTENAGSSMIQATPPEPHSGAIAASQAPIKTSFSSYVNYESKAFPKEWLAIKDNYTFLFENQDKLPAHSLHQINSMLSNCLPAIIAADMSIQAGQQMYITKTKELLVENLHMVNTQLSDYRQELDAQMVKSLEVAKNYQKMKLGK